MDQPVADQPFPDRPRARDLPALHVDAAGTARLAASETIVEVPVAFSYGGVAHAVMMASPGDLRDFAVGFSLTEGIAAPDQLRGIDIRPAAEGIALEIGLAPAQLQAFLARRRVRSLRGHTSCGLCGVEDLADLPRPAAPLPPGASIGGAAILAALVGLRRLQPLSMATRAAHAAAWADPAGTLMLVREDVGRHNALDKLIGACLRDHVDLADGFCLVTSRCSFEMVQKAVAARMPAVVAVSAPTELAVQTAIRSGLTLIARASPAGYTVYAPIPSPA